VILGLLLQLTAAGSIAATVASSDGFYRDRETFGVRWRSPGVEMGYEAPLTLQVGVMAANENGLFPSKSGAGVRHWALALEQQFVPGLRASVIYGRFIEQRSDERPHPGLPQITYYQLLAFGVEVRDSAGHAVLTLEKLLAHPKAVHVGLHTFIARLRSPPADVMLQLIEGSEDQGTGYQFLTAEATVRPLWRLGAPWRYLGLQGGTRPVPSYSSDRSVALRFLSAGVFWSVP
jgi:hypothetical protein